MWQISVILSPPALFSPNYQTVFASRSFVRRQLFANRQIRIKFKMFPYWQLQGFSTADTLQAGYCNWSVDNQLTSSGIYIYTRVKRTQYVGTAHTHTHAGRPVSGIKINLDDLWTTNTDACQRWRQNTCASLIIVCYIYICISKRPSKWSSIPPDSIT